MSLGNVDLLWLVAGVVLHLGSQLARGRGWHSVVCAAHPAADHPRRRDVLLTWVAGAGASGVLSARGGDALRILLLRRRMTTTCPTLAGTLAAETVAETALGALLTVWALSAGLIPGLHRPGLATAALVVAGVPSRSCSPCAAPPAASPRSPARAPTPAAASRCSAAPARYVRRVGSWGVLSRALRIVVAAVLPRRLRARRLADRRARRDGRPQRRAARAVRPRGRRREPRPARRGVPGRHAHAHRRRRADRVLPRHDRGADRGRHRALGARARARARVRRRTPRGRATRSSACACRARRPCASRPPSGGPSPSGSASARGGRGGCAPCARGGRARRAATPPTPPHARAAPAPRAARG